LFGTRLTSDLISLVDWDDRLVEKSDSISPTFDPNLSDSRHHLSVLCPAIAVVADGQAETPWPTPSSHSSVKFSPPGKF